MKSFGILTPRITDTQEILLVKEKHLTKPEMWCRIPHGVKQKALTPRRQTWKR